MSRPFGSFIFWQIFHFRQKKSAISDIVPCILFMRVLHGDLQVIHGDFQPSSKLHCSSCVSEYKLVLLLFNYPLIH